MYQSDMHCSSSQKAHFFLKVFMPDNSFEQLFLQNFDVTVKPYHDINIETRNLKRNGVQPCNSWPLHINIVKLKYIDGNTK